MKKVILTILTFAMSLSMFAATIPTESRMEKLHGEITRLLGTPTIELEDEVTIAKISFTLSTENEIVVLSVDSKNEHVDYYVKSSLNYKKVSFKATELGKVFSINLKILKG